ncbi:DUF4998 domain-containing protein [Leeuwenhoekiella parthenopeia]|uniref:DUF5013 domain-containing protein n=1 Tax=Leeuwenhoekiella parthenopeia TaxID=2890320 RepID=A0ABS8GVH7_9FLAO|nr:DUF4998 domain-containing protein [Leeuwenhoekiella parthenopeia]MCC4213972.1 DUF5013 domain-containing protein [Leeuwenhoekiella parthenopeia]
MKKFTLISFKICTILFGFLFLAACDSDDTLTVMPQDDSVAQLKTFSIKPGENRVKIEGTVPAEADIEEVVVYWNDRANSLRIPISPSNEEQQFSEYIPNLEERVYTFEMQTSDGSGSGSAIVTGASEVYGASYRNTLLNRPVSNSTLAQSKLDIQFDGMDFSTGPIGIELSYENTSGELQNVFFPISQDRVILNDYKRNTNYKYRTVFVPSPLAVDTFYIDYNSVTPQVEFPELKNNAVPFSATSVSGRWGVLADWTTTAPVLIHPGGHGGWDQWNGNIFNMESGWGASAINNGKIYQSVEAPAGNYALEISVRDSNHSETDEGGSYFVVSKGFELPDVSDVTTDSEVLVFERIHTTTYVANMPEIYRLEFSLDEITDITIGQITSQWGQTPGRFCNILSFELIPAD